MDNLDFIKNNRDHIKEQMDEQLWDLESCFLIATGELFSEDKSVGLEILTRELILSSIHKIREIREYINCFSNTLDKAIQLLSSEI